MKKEEFFEIAKNISEELKKIPVLWEKVLLDLEMLDEEVIYFLNF